jgi:hypothetical protein
MVLVTFPCEIITNYMLPSIIVRGAKGQLR